MSEASDKPKAVTKKMPSKPVAKKPVAVTQSAAASKPAPKAAAVASVAKPAVAAKPKPAVVNTPAKPTPVWKFCKAAWKKLDDWNVGISGKVIIILIVIGMIGSIFNAF